MRFGGMMDVLVVDSRRIRPTAARWGAALLSGGNASHLSLPRVVTWPETSIVHADARGIICLSNAAARRLLQSRARRGVPLAAALLHIGWPLDPEQLTEPSQRVVRLASAGRPHLVRLERQTFGKAHYHRLMLLPLPPEVDAVDPHWSVMGQLAAAAAHEIRNPLTTARGFLQMLREDTPAGVEHDHLTIVLREIDRVTELVGDLLTLTRPASLDPVPVDLGEIAQEVLEACQQLIAERRQTCDLAAAERSLVRGSRMQLRQLVLNLVRNAVDAAPTGGRIRVEIARAPGERIHVRVDDDGPGFSAEVREHAFEPFFTTKDSGTGLGLVICRQIVEAHGGALTIEDREGGASLLCSLPVLQETGDA